ncbi:hypothetical protein EYZ11_011090 [Aspergillus tanneri]|uniref:phosphatidylinositol-3,4,5-trisphosphate 3-phosphatase n=1 Tax=Aspergillus tanneri TaxID=1220188 RepID=A0A4S3J410_9EURO|nr:hypothetical protein EYZ11_011090 [Aspergillus tanneri]
MVRPYWISLLLFYQPRLTRNLVVVATSGPSSTYPQRAYRNPLDELVNFLDTKHGEDWCIWEFRAEGTGYPDEEVYGRIHHFPFPDHHPPPFALIPAIMGSMKNWIQRLDDTGQEKSPDKENKGKRVAVVHCKAGKGRSGTIVCSYLISQEGWKLEDALQRFTERRMRSGFGHGVSIQSQLRWVGYVDRWANQMAKVYIERPVEILEIHVWGLRDGVKVAVEGFVEEGKRIKNLHLFHRSERTVIDNGMTTLPESDDRKAKSGTNSHNEPLWTSTDASTGSNLITPITSSDKLSTSTKTLRAAIFRPSKPVIVPTSDVNIDFERRSKAPYTGWAMVTSIAHIWFNTFFEGGDKLDSGVFDAEWDVMDGIKGTTKKGTKALDRLKVVWRYPTPSQLGAPESNEESAAPIPGQTITEPEPGEPIPESHPADWHGLKIQYDGVGVSRDQENTPLQVSKSQENQSEDMKSQASNSTQTGISTTAASAAATAVHSTQELREELGPRKQTTESQHVSLAESDDNSPVLGRRKCKAAEKKEGLSTQHLQEMEEDGDFEGTQPYFEIGNCQDGSSRVGDESTKNK